MRPCRACAPPLAQQEQGGAASGDRDVDLDGGAGADEGTGGGAAAQRGHPPRAVRREHRQPRHRERDREHVVVRPADELEQQQRVGRPQERAAQRAPRVSACRPLEQESRGHERQGVRQRHDEHRQAYRGAACQRGERLLRGGDRPVDGGGVLPVLHRARHRVGGQVACAGGVRVVAGGRHPAVRRVVEVVGGADGRHQRERRRGEHSGGEQHARTERPASARGEQAESQPGRREEDAGCSEDDDEVRGGMGDEGVRRLPAAAGERGLHDGGPERGDREKAGEPGRAQHEPRGPAPVPAPYGAGGRSGGAERVSVRHGAGGSVAWPRWVRGPPGHGRHRGTGGRGAPGPASRCPWHGARAAPRPR